MNSELEAAKATLNSKQASRQLRLPSHLQSLYNQFLTLEAQIKVLKARKGQCRLSELSLGEVCIRQILAVRSCLYSVRWVREGGKTDLIIDTPDDLTAGKPKLRSGQFREQLVAMTFVHLSKTHPDAKVTVPFGDWPKGFDLESVPIVMALELKPDAGARRPETINGRL